MVPSLDPLLILAMSTHEKRQAALAKQIAELESEAVGPKDWTLLGEATARARPENSLLEEHLDFEHVGKVVPVVTEETVKTLEEMIKKRIIEVSLIHLGLLKTGPRLTSRTTSTRPCVFAPTNRPRSSPRAISSCKIRSLRNRSLRSTRKSTKLLLPEAKSVMQGMKNCKRHTRRLSNYGEIYVTSSTR